MNERQPNSLEHEKCSSLEWQHRKTRLLWLMWPSSQCLGKSIRASPLLFTRTAADVISEACFTAMTGDRHDDLAAMDLSRIAVALTVIISMNFNSYASFALFFIIPVLFYFVFELETIYTVRVSVSRVWFLLPYVSSQIQLSVTRFKTQTVPFRFLFEDFRFCSRYDNVNYVARHVYKPLFGSSVVTCRLACSENSL